MSGLNGMEKQVQRLEAKAPPIPEKHMAELNLSLFTDVEQAHIYTLWELMENTFDFDHLHRLTHNQFEYVSLVIHMDEVDQGSEQAATRHRQMAELSADPHFTQSLDRLVDLFLSIDESRVPDYAEVKEWYKQRESLPPDYHLRRSWFRERKAWIERELARCEKWRGERLYFNNSRYEAEMRAWVDAYGDA